MVALLLGILIVSAVVLAEPTNFSISRWTVDDGGGNSNNGQYVLSGSIGQFDAHTASIGGDYVVRGGFWQAGITGGSYDIYLPLVIDQ